MIARHDHSAFCGLIKHQRADQTGFGLTGRPVGGFRFHQYPVEGEPVMEPVSGSGGENVSPSGEVGLMASGATAIDDDGPFASGAWWWNREKDMAGDRALAIDIVFASHDGQTRRIANALAGHLGAAGIDVRTTDLADDRNVAVRREAITVLAAPIRYGYPLRIADRFLRRNGERIVGRRLVLVLVHLAARKPGRDTVAGNPYLRKWIARRGLSPAIAAGVAGRLSYPTYSWYDRSMIRLIMTMTGGPTDPTATVEYTDWGQVERLAGAIAGLARSEAMAD